jgi:hypothetical protein
MADEKVTSAVVLVTLLILIYILRQQIVNDPVSGSIDDFEDPKDKSERLEEDLPPEFGLGPLTEIINDGSTNPTSPTGSTNPTSPTGSTNPTSPTGPTSSQGSDDPDKPPDDNSLIVDKTCEFPANMNGVEGCPPGMIQNVLTEGRENCCVFENNGCDKKEWWQVLSDDTTSTLGQYDLGCKKTDKTIEAIALTSQLILFEMMQGGLKHIIKSSATSAKLPVNKVKPVTSGPVKPAVTTKGVKPGTTGPVKPGVANKVVKPVKTVPMKPVYWETSTRLKPTTSGPVKPGVANKGVKPVTSGPVKPGVANKGVKPTTSGPVKPGVANKGVKPTTSGPVKPGVANKGVKPTTSGPVKPGVANKVVKPVTSGAVNPKVPVKVTRPSIKVVAPKVNVAAAGRTRAAVVGRYAMSTRQVMASNRVLARAGKRLGLSAGKSGAKIGAKLGAKLAAKAATRGAVCASGGPAGWAAFALMIAFEVIIFALDFVDVDGYGSGIFQDHLSRIRNKIDLAGYRAAVSQQTAYPYLYPMQGENGFVKDHYEAAHIHMFTEMSEKYIQPALSGEVELDNTDGDSEARPPSALLAQNEAYTKSFGDYLRKVTEIEEKQAKKYYEDRGFNAFGDDESKYPSRMASPDASPTDGKRRVEIKQNGLDDAGKPILSLEVHEVIEVDGIPDDATKDLINTPTLGNPYLKWNLYIVRPPGLWSLDSDTESDTYGEYLYMPPMIYNMSETDTWNGIEPGEMMFMLEYIKNRHFPNISTGDEFPWTAATDAEIARQLSTNEIPPEPEMPEALLDWQMTIPDIYHEERDTYIFNHLKRSLTLADDSRADQIELVPHMSLPNRVGITITEDAALTINNLNKEKWIADNDMFNPPDRTLRETMEDKHMAVFTDTFYVPAAAYGEPAGDENNPNMIEMKIKDKNGNLKKTVLSGAYAPLLAYCEKPRQTSESSGGVDPYGLGVRFDYNTLRCTFTEKYCDRYGMEFKGNDCQSYEGMDFAEMIFGKTVSRGVVRTYKDYVYDYYTSGDPLKIAGAVVFTSNPALLAAWAIGNVAVREISNTVHKKSKPLKKRSCKWYNSRYTDTGTDCWLNTGVKKSSQKKLKPCDDWSDKYGDKLRDDGSSCWRDMIVKKTRMADKLKCDGTIRDGNGNVIIDKGWKNAYGKLTEDGTSCWKHIYFKRAAPAEKYSCKGPEMRDNKTGKLKKYDNGKQMYEWTHQEDGIKLEDDGTSCWKYPPKWRGVGKLPGCPEGKEKDGLFCYTKCDDAGYKNRAKDGREYQGIGPVCYAKNCPPKKPLKRGLICYEDCRKDENGNEIPNRYNLSLINCGRCPPGKKRDLGGKGAGCVPADGGGNAGTQILKGFENFATGKWSPMSYPKRDQEVIDSFTRDSGDFTTTCPPDRTNDSGLCYKRCSQPKSEETGEEVTKYTGVGPWCLRKNGIAEIKKTVFDRYKCGPSRYQSDKCKIIDTAFSTNSSDKDKKIAVEELVKMLEDENAPLRMTGHRRRVRLSGAADISVIEGVKKLVTSAGTEEFKKEVEYLLDCPDLRTNVAGVCWDTCRPGDADHNAFCVPKIGAGIKKTWLDGSRQLCGTLTNPPTQCQYVDDNNIDEVIKALKAKDINEDWMPNEYDGTSWQLGVSLIQHIRENGITPQNVWIVQEKLGCLRKNVGGVCWDKCPPEKREDGGLGVKFDDAGGGPFCFPEGGAGIRVWEVDRRRECGISSYQPKKCEYVEQKNVTKTLTNLENIGEGGLVSDLNENGFTDDNTQKINEALGCPKMRKYQLGRCWDTCPRSNLNPDNKNTLKMVKAAKNVSQDIATLRQKQYDDWKGVWDIGNYIDVDTMGWSDQPHPENPDLTGLIPRRSEGVLAEYQAMGSLERTKELENRSEVLTDARNTFDELNTKYNQELDTFRKDFSLGYKDLQLTCSPLGTRAYESNPQDYADAEESAELAEMTNVEKNAGLGLAHGGRRVIPLSKRLYCSDPDMKRHPGDLVNCWAKCPPGYRDDGWTCNKNIKN